MENSRGGDLFVLIVVSPQASRARRHAHPSIRDQTGDLRKASPLVAEHRWQVVLDHVNKVGGFRAVIDRISQCGSMYGFDGSASRVQDVWIAISSVGCAAVDNCMRDERRPLESGNRS
jgi:hypothetical protein